MKAQATFHWIAIPALVLSFAACGGGATDNTGAAKTDTLNTSTQEAPGGVMKVAGRIISIPAPVQTALLFRKLGLPYDKSLPLGADMAGKFATKFQRALGLGIYGADIAYVTIHRDAQRALNSLTTVEMLGGQLELTNAFDKSLLERFKKSLSNEDSLLRFTGVAFRSADEYLKANDRNDVSALILAGGWLESMYLTMASTPATVDPALANRVGEQRRTLESLIALLEQNDPDKTNTAIVAGLKDVLTAYAGVTSTYQFQPPTQDAPHKTTFINSVTSVNISPEQFKAISDKVKALRSTIIV